MSGLLRLADGGKQSQIRERVGSGALDDPTTNVCADALVCQLYLRARSQTLFVFFERFEMPFLLSNFFPGAFAATISYDCPINSRNSLHGTASSRSSITHL
jgi:hypothetical protein